MGQVFVIATPKTSISSKYRGYALEPVEAVQSPVNSSDDEDALNSGSQNNELSHE